MTEPTTANRVAAPLVNHDLSAEHIHALRGALVQYVDEAPLVAALFLDRNGQCVLSAGNAHLFLDDARHLRFFGEYDEEAVERETHPALKCALNSIWESGDGAFGAFTQLFADRLILIAIVRSEDALGLAQYMTSVVLIPVLEACGLPAKTLETYGRPWFGAASMRPSGWWKERDDNR